MNSIGCFFFINVRKDFWIYINSKFMNKNFWFFCKIEMFKFVNNYNDIKNNNKG